MVVSTADVLNSPQLSPFIKVTGNGGFLAKSLLTKRLHSILKTWQCENDGAHGKINAIWWNFKINVQKLADICEYELPRNFMQKDITEVKIFQKVLWGYFFETPCTSIFLPTINLYCSCGLSTIYKDDDDDNDVSLSPSTIGFSGSPGRLNPLIGTLKQQSSGLLHINTVIGTLAVDGWAVKFGTARRGLGGLGPRPVPPRCTKSNSPPINGQCINFILFDVAL